MAYSFKKTTEVKSDICSEVVFTIRKITEARRSDLRLSLAGLLDRLTDLTNDLKTLDPVKDEKAIRAKGFEIDDFVSEKIEPAKIRWATVRVDGLMIEDAAGTLDNLPEWPSELRSELLSIIEDGSVMLVSEAKNSPRPTTSGGQVAPIAQSSTAASAASPSTSTTPTETALATSPSA